MSTSLGVGRSAAAKSFGEEAIRLAVIAHIHHEKTDYDQLLMAGQDPHQARARVQPQIESTPGKGRGSSD